jgi:predicted deacetylase
VADEIQLTLEDEQAVMPAARCRRCGVVTWKCSLLKGTWKVKHASHHIGCHAPPGRLDCRVLATHLKRREIVLKCLRCLDDEEAQTLLDELLG